MRAAARDLDEMIASCCAAEADLRYEYKQINRAAREKERDARSSIGGRRQYSRAGCWESACVR